MKKGWEIVDTKEQDEIRSGFIDLSGKTFGEWLVIRRGFEIGDSKKRTRFLCKCSCGREKLVLSQNLLKGDSKNCGHDKGKKTKERFTTHGLHDSAEYGIWRGIIARCTKPNRKEYQEYGGRGIKVCDEWLTFARFFKDMGWRPSEAHSIDRIDVNGHYEPSNCRWATRSVQNLNKRPRSEFPGTRRKRTSSGGVEARIMVDGKQIHLGTFKTNEEASEAYEKVRKQAIEASCKK